MKKLVTLGVSFVLGQGSIAAAVAAPASANGPAVLAPGCFIKCGAISPVRPAASRPSRIMTHYVYSAEVGLRSQQTGQES